MASHVSRSTIGGASFTIHSDSGRSRRARLPVSGSLTHLDLFHATRPMYFSLRSNGCKAEMGHLPRVELPSKRGFHVAPGEGMPRLFESAAIPLSEAPAANRANISRTISGLSYALPPVGRPVRARSCNAAAAG